MLCYKSSVVLPPLYLDASNCTLYGAICTIASVVLKMAICHCFLLGGGGPSQQQEGQV